MTSNVAPRLCPALARFHHDLSKLLRLREPSERIDRQLIELIGPDGRLADLANRRLNVLRPNGLHDVIGADIARGQELGVEPNADAVVALARHKDIGDAIDPEQLIAEQRVAAVTERQ